LKAGFCISDSLQLFNDKNSNEQYWFVQILAKNIPYTCFSFFQLTWLPIVIYVPALAFNQVTGINVHVITPIVCIVCIFYTCVVSQKFIVPTSVLSLTHFQFPGRSESSCVDGCYPNIFNVWRYDFGDSQGHTRCGRTKCCMGKCNVEWKNWGTRVRIFITKFPCVQLIIEISLSAPVLMFMCVTQYGRLWLVVFLTGWKLMQSVKIWWVHRFDQKLSQINKNIDFPSTGSEIFIVAHTERCDSVI
jgi:hypothetical protein